MEHKAFLSEDLRQEDGERLGHFAELREHEDAVLTRGDLLAELGEPLEFAALLALPDPVARELGGMVADLLELEEGGEYEASSLHAARLAKVSESSSIVDR